MNLQICVLHLCVGVVWVWVGVWVGVCTGMAQCVCEGQWTTFVAPGI